MGQAWVRMSWSRGWIRPEPWDAGSRRCGPAGSGQPGPGHGIPRQAGVWGCNWAGGQAGLDSVALFASGHQSLRAYGCRRRSGRAVRAQLRSGASSPARLRSASRFGSSSRSTGLGSEMVAAAARREGVCARARARLCAGESPRSPARPLLPPALHAAMPAESLTRAPTLRGAHTRARVHPFAAPPAPHAPLALLGRPQRAQNAARGAR